MVEYIHAHDDNIGHQYSCTLIGRFDQNKVEDRDHYSFVRNNHPHMLDIEKKYIQKNHNKNRGLIKKKNQIILTDTSVLYPIPNVSKTALKDS